MPPHFGLAVCFDENDVRVMGRDAYGVRGIKLRDGDYVVGAARATAGKTVLSITENGYGKRTPVEEYRITNRGGLGIKNYAVTEKTRACGGHQGGGRVRGPAAGHRRRYPHPHPRGRPSASPGVPPRASSSCASRRRGTR